MTQYYNPQQEPGSERRLLIVFALTFLVLIIFQPLLSRYMRQQEPAAPPQKAEQQAEQKKQPSQPSSSAAPSSTVAAPGAAVGTQPPAVLRQAEGDAETVVENDVYRITFTNRGGKVTSWILKKHQDEQGRPLDLVHHAAAGEFGYPLSLWTYDEQVRERVNSALYVPSRTGNVSAPADLTFEYADENLSVRKTFHFTAESYVIGIDTVVEQNGKVVSAYPAWPAGFGDQHTAASYASSRIEWQYGEDVQRVQPKAVSGGSTLTGPFQWVGVADQYFAAIFLPESPAQVGAVTLRHALEVPSKAADPESKKTPVELLGLAVGDPRGATSQRIFVGPKALDVLESVQVPPVAGQAEPINLTKVVDFGKWLGWIAYPLFLWLRWTYHTIVANWGWAIVVLTIIINLVLFPLRLSSMKSAMKMQKLQPQMNAVKDKYRAKMRGLNDRARKMELSQQQHQEIAALFKSEGANPAGGCLPLLLQMPFLIAFYSMLANANELRNASFLWIRDLSSPDPYYIIPILIIASTFAMQKMTPQAGMDPAQQKVMTVMMPVMLGVISWTLSAGLGVYWILGNMIGIGQQQALNRTHFGKEMRAMAEKRARQRKEKSSASK